MSALPLQLDSVPLWLRTILGGAGVNLADAAITQIAEGYPIIRRSVMADSADLDRLAVMVPRIADPIRREQARLDLIAARQFHTPREQAFQQLTSYLRAGIQRAQGFGIDPGQWARDNGLGVLPAIPALIAVGFACIAAGSVVVVIQKMEISSRENVKLAYLKAAIDQGTIIDPGPAPDMPTGGGPLLNVGSGAVGGAVGGGLVLAALAAVLFLYGRR